MAVKTPNYLDPESIKPWERMDGEINRWFQRFEIYRSLGYTRSIFSAYETERKNLQKPVRFRQGQRHPPVEWTMNASKWKWIVRAQAYDEYERQVLIERRHRQLIEAQDRHLNAGRLLQQHALKRLHPNTFVPEAELDVPNALKFVTEGVKLELTAVGAASEIRRTELSGRVQTVEANASLKDLLSHATDDELAILESLAERAQSAAEKPTFEQLGIPSLSDQPDDFV